MTGMNDEALQRALRQPTHEERAISQQWMQNVDEQMAAKTAKGKAIARRIYLSVAAVIAVVALAVGCSVTRTEGIGPAMANMVFAVFAMGLLLGVPTLITVGYLRRSGKFGRDATTMRMYALERQYPGWYSRELWRQQYSTPVTALRGPQTPQRRGR